MCVIVLQDITILGGNSYIELWDTQYGRIVGVYDRVFLGLSELNIIDAKVMPENRVLYLLDYSTGIYQLQLVFDKLVAIGSVIQLTFYTKIAVIGEDSLIVSKKGALAELANMHQKGASIFKYEIVSNEEAKQLVVST